mgnify:CR=1 FL=1
MKTTKHKIVLHANGENQSTYGVLGALVKLKKTIDLNEKVDRFVSWDCNIPVSVPRYKVVEVTLPSWLTVDEWMRDEINWRWTWGLGVQKDWAERRQRKLFNLHLRGKGYLSGQATVLAITKLIKSEPRKEERKALKRKVLNWLGRKDGELKVPHYALVNKYIVDEANGIDRILYNSGILA